MVASRRLLALALLVALVGSLVAAPGVARPPPKSLCATCAEADGRDTVGGVAIEVTAAEADIRIDENGTGHWTERVKVNEAAADELRSDATRRQFVADAFEGYVAVEDPQNLRSHVDGRTLVVEYEVPGMAHRSAGGVLLVDFFYWHGDSGRWFSVDADRVVLEGPDGMALTRVPPGAAVDGNRAVWLAGSGPTRVGGHGYAAFAPEGGLGAAAATELAVQADVLQASAADLPGVAAVPVGLLALVVALLAFGGRWVARGSWRRRAGKVVGLTALLGVASVAAPALAETMAFGDALFGWMFMSFLGGAFLLVPVGLLEAGAAYALVTGWRPWDEGPILPAPGSAGAVGVRATLVASAAAVLGVGVVTGGLALAAGGRVAPAVGLLFLGPVALFLPLGASERTGHPVRHVLRVAIVAAPAGLGLLLGPFGGYAASFLPVFLAPWAVVTAFVGLLAWPLGFRLATTDPGDAARSASAAAVDRAD